MTMPKENNKLHHCHDNNSRICFICSTATTMTTKPISSSLSQVLYLFLVGLFCSMVLLALLLFVSSMNNNIDTTNLLRHQDYSQHQKQQHVLASSLYNLYSLSPLKIVSCCSKVHLIPFVSSCVQHTC